MGENRFCGNCGGGFVSNKPNELFCFPCELAIRAVEPPELLKDLRLVYSGRQAVTPGQVSLAKLMADNIGQFTDRMVKAEDQYRAGCVRWEAARAQKAAASGAIEKWSGKGMCQGCGRGPDRERVVDVSTAKLIGKVESWVKRQPEKEGEE